MYFTEEPEHIRLIRDSVRKFAAEHMPREKVRQWEKQNRYDPAVFRKLADMGLCGLTIAEEHGGAGVDIVAAIAVIDELAQAGGATIGGPFTHAAFYGGMNISENGSDEQKRELLPKLARGEILFAYGLSEPDVGGDLSSVACTARRTPSGSVIVNGTKRWCTAVEVADYVYCLVKSDNDAPKYRNLSIVLVPTKAKGTTIVPIEHIGIRYAGTGDFIMEDVEVPAWNIVGGEAGWNKGWKMLAGPALDVEKLEISASTLGIATAAVEEAWQYSQERKQFGKPICAHQAVRHALVEARTRLQACKHMLYHAAWLANEGKPCAVETSMAKLFIADTAVEIVLACQRVMGAYGCAEGYDMERHVRDIVCMPIVGGSSNMQKNNIANRLHLPA